MPSFFKKKKIPHPERVGNCKIINHKSKKKYDLDKLLTKFSDFCEGKTVRIGRGLGKGSYGSVYEVEIDGTKFAVKILEIYLEDTFVLKEKEVGLTIALSDLRRSDGQRICISVYDCFFLCQSFNEESCLGHMFYIMEYGEGSMRDLFKRRKEIPGTDSTANYKVLLRDSLVKMMENIDLFVRNTNMINIDTKPENSVFNFKNMEDSSLVQVNPIIIDIDENYCIPIDENIVDFDKLNKVLVEHNLKKEPLTEDEIKMAFSFLYQISFLNLAFDRILNQADGIEILREVILAPKEPNESFSLLEIMELLVKATNENCWIGGFIQLILSTNFVDKGSGSKKYASLIRKMFFQYNYFGPKRDTKDKKFIVFINNIGIIYKLILEKDGKQPDLRMLILDHKKIEHTLRTASESAGAKEETNA